MIRLLAPLALVLVACAPESSAPPAEPIEDGAVLAVNDQRITAEEVDALAAHVGELFPAYTRPHRRRLALTNVLLPLAAVRARFATERARALDDATKAAATLRGDDQAARSALEALATEREGHWKILGLELWGGVRELPLASWSDPIERVGRFTIARVDVPAPPGTLPEREQLTLSVLEFPYLDPPVADKEIEEAVDASELRILDPAWNELVPEAWKFRMRSEQ